MIVSTIVLLYVYRIANQRLGIEQIGLWSIVTTLTSFGNLGTFGITGSLVKFSAEYQSKGEKENIVKLLNSFIVIMMAMLMIFLFLLYFFAILFLDKIIDINYLQRAFELLPYSFAIFFISTIGYLILSVIEGLNKGWQKNLVIITSNLALLIAACIWIDKHGIKGIFFAQLVQALVIFSLSIIILRINFKEYIWSGFTMDKKLLMRVTTYGLKFQSVSVFQMLGEPVTKFFLSRYGGLGLVGMFEMASRLVLQIRSILATVVSSLLPRLVAIHSSPTENVKAVFKRIFEINFDLFAFVYGFVILFSPVILQLWLGDANTNLVNLIRLFTIAWFVNSISIVPYIFNLGSGKLNGNVISHALIGLCNLLFGLVIILVNAESMTFIYAWIFSLVVGSGYILLEYLNRNGMSYSELFSFKYVIAVLITLLNYILLVFLLSISTLNNYLLFVIVGLNYLWMMCYYIYKSASFAAIRGYFSSFSLLPSNKSL